MTERVKSGLTWRGLETGYGEASEAPSNERDGQQIGFTYETPRQSSTLPGSSMHGASLTGGERFFERGRVRVRVLQ